MSQDGIDSIWMDIDVRTAFEGPAPPICCGEFMSRGNHYNFNCRVCGRRNRSRIRMHCQRCGKELSRQQAAARRHTVKQFKRMHGRYPQGPFCSRDCARTRRETRETWEDICNLRQESTA
jgi:hypothetical protein